MSASRRPMTLAAGAVLVGVIAVGLSAVLEPDAGEERRAGAARGDFPGPAGPSAPSLVLDRATHAAGSADALRSEPGADAAGATGPTGADVPAVGGVRGRVRDAVVGRPLEDVQVVAVPRDPDTQRRVQEVKLAAVRSRPGGWGRDRARTGADGAFRLSELPAGHYELVVDSPEYVTTRRPFDLGPGADAVVDLDLERGGTVTGVVVTTSGRPVGDVAVLGRAALGRAPPRRTTSGPGGAFTLTGLPAGSVEVWSEGAAWLGSGPQLVYLPPAHPATDGVSLVVQRPASISGVVRDERGAPARGAQVFCMGPERRPGAPVVAADGGAYVLGGLQAGRYRVVARSPGGEVVASADVDVPGGADVSLDLTLHDAAVIQGRLVDVAGRPLSSVEVTASAATGHVSREDATDAEGRFVLPALYPGEYELQLSRAGRRLCAEPARFEVASHGAPSDLLVVGDPGAVLTGRVIGVDRAPAPFVSLEAVRGESYVGRAQPASDGSFVLGGLTPGPVDLCARTFDGAAAWRATLDVPPEGELRLDILLQPTATVLGRAVDSTGRPLAGALVTFRSAGPRLEGGGRVVRALTGPGGEFELSQLLPGPGALTVLAGRLAARTDLELSGGERRTVEATLAPDP